MNYNYYFKSKSKRSASVVMVKKKETVTGFCMQVGHAQCSFTPISLLLISGLDTGHTIFSSVDVIPGDPELFFFF